jgi:hypothetical protein
MTSQTPTARRAEHRHRDLMTGPGSALAAMYAGLAFTAIATFVPYLDRATSNALAEHIRAGYPAYTTARIETAANIYLVYLSVIGALGIAGWVWTIHAVKAGSRWARAGATMLFALAAIVALTDLLIRDTSGDTGLPHLLGWVGILPCVPGLLAVIQLWRRP